MTSGALLLRPKVLNVRQWLVKRVTRIGCPLVFWSLLYMLANGLTGQKGELSCLRILSMPFCAEGNGVLWFLYTLLGLYFLTPILNAWLLHATRRQIQGILILWGISLCFPLFDIWLDINREIDGMLYYFSGYVGYFLLGYYLNTYRDALRLNLIWPLIIIAIVAPIITRLAGWEVNFYEIFWYLSPFVAILVVTIWKMVMNFCRTLCASTSLVLCSNLTFGIYLIQMLVMRYWLQSYSWIYDINPYPVRALTVAILTLLISGIAVYLLSFLPYSQYIIGTHNRLPIRRRVK